MYHGSMSESQWGGWSDWCWDATHGRHYRCRQDDEGNTVYDWDMRDTAAAAAAADPQTPRDATTIGDITESMRGLSTGSYEDESVPKERSRKSKSSKSKGKNRHQKYSYDEDTSQDIHGTSATDSLHDPEAGQNNYVTSQYVPHESSAAQYYQHSTSDSQAAEYYPGTDMTSGDYATSGSTVAHNEQETADYDQEGAELEDAIAASGQYNYSAYANAGEPSSSAYARYDEDEEEDSPTPKPQESPGGYHITSCEQISEELDPRYRVEHSTRFQPGEIFKVHWSEPQGAGNGAPSVSGKHEIQNRFGTKFFVGFRRFIVVANDQGHCTCVPILTYGGKACKKKGVKADKHGIIYESGRGKPRLLDQEPELGFNPVRVIMKEEGERLSRESRVNYSKLVTVEHNVKVFFIGSVVDRDCTTVQEAVNYCWSKKHHHKQKHT